MKLDKKKVDEVIRITKKYYKTGDVDLLDISFNIKKELVDVSNWNTTDLVADLSKFTQNKHGTYQQIYAALAVFGIEIQDENS